MSTLRKNIVTEALDYHTTNGVNLAENIFRPGTEAWHQVFVKARQMWAEGTYEPRDWFEEDLLKSDIGCRAWFEGKEVSLDVIFEDKEPELNQPKAGGAKKYYVYVKNDKGNVVKVQWGDTSGLKIKLNDPEARKSFAARHKCSEKKDKTKPGYWACRMPRYASSLGLKADNPNSFW